MLKIMYLAGPDPDKAMTFARGHYDSIYGRIESAWSIRDGKLLYTATVPGNTTATLYLPASSPEGITEGRKPAAKSEGVQFLRYENGKAVSEVLPGSYQFESTY